MRINFALILIVCLVSAYLYRRIFVLQEKDLAKEVLLIQPKLIVEVPKDIPTNGLIPIEEEEMNFPEGATLDEKIQLSRPGTLIVLPEIQFYKNTFGIMPSSQREIFELIDCK